MNKLVRISQRPTHIDPEFRETPTRTYRVRTVSVLQTLCNDNNGQSKFKAGHGSSFHQATNKVYKIGKSLELEKCVVEE